MLKMIDLTDKSWDIVWKCAITNSRWWSLVFQARGPLAQRRQTQYARSPIVERRVTGTSRAERQKINRLIDWLMRFIACDSTRVSCLSLSYEPVRERGIDRRTEGRTNKWARRVMRPIGRPHNNAKSITATPDGIRLWRTLYLITSA